MKTRNVTSFLKLTLLMISTVPFDTLAVGLPHTSEHPDGIQCHLPNLEEAMIKHEKLLTTPKFVEYSCSPLEGRYDKCTKLGGIGNFLVLFPAVYLAAMLTGRELIIHDNSVLGQWCRAINCGFQFTSDVEKKYPLLFEKVKHVTQFTQNDYAYKLRINASIPDTIVGFRGMDVYASKWFQYAGALAGPCIEHITGCNPKLIGCIERFAFRQLFPGGFAENAIPDDVSGMSTQLLKAMLTKPYETLPHFAAGVHIRAQRNSLEHGSKSRTNINSTHIAHEMKEYSVLFQQFETVLSDYFFHKAPIRVNITNATLTGLWPQVFISCDDIDIRDAFVSVLSNRSSDKGQFALVYVNTTHIRHMKHIDYENTTAPSQSIVNTAFDWYALSLSKVLFAWRNGYSPMPSTFMQSATRVSMLKRTKYDFKATILRSNGKWLPTFEYTDDLSEVEAEEKKHRKHKHSNNK